MDFKESDTITNVAGAIISKIVHFCGITGLNWRV